MKITVKVQTSSKMNMYCVNQGIFYIGDASCHVTLVIRFIVCFIFYICFIVLFVYLILPTLSPVLRRVHLLICYSLPIPSKFFRLK